MDHTRGLSGTRRNIGQNFSNPSRDRQRGQHDNCSEFHIDETPRAFWSIEGFRPPPGGSEAEMRWLRENEPSCKPNRGLRTTPSDTLEETWVAG
jgi:hypothetical protein